MIEEIIRYLKNPEFFIPEKEIIGDFKIENGMINLPFLDGQYFWIEGSVFNDGLHKNPDDDFEDEEFYGRIVPMKIPKILLDKLPEMEAYDKWRTERITSGADFQSESFNGYSYQLRMNNNGQLYTAIEYFKDFLNQWRCI